jgi:hypothetical protein
MWYFPKKNCLPSTGEFYDYYSAYLLDLISLQQLKNIEKIRVRIIKFYGLDFVIPEVQRITIFLF